MTSSKKNLNIIGPYDVMYTVPVQIDKHLEFVDISTNNELLLGSSNLNGCYWKGSIWYFLEPENAPLRDKVYSGLQCDTGICDGKFLSEDKVIIGEDSGMVSIIALNRNLVDNDEHRSKFSVEHSRSEHDHAVLSVSVSEDRTKAVTGSVDKCIKVWDVSSERSDDLMSVHTYRPIHKEPVTSVSMKPTCPNGNIFASSSLDGTVLLLDSRMTKPAQVIHEDVAIGFGSVAWTSDTNIVAGSTMGDISLIDTRNRDVLLQTNVTSRPIHRVVVHKHLVAVCADDMYVRVLDLNKSSSEGASTSNIIYTDNKHKDYVRGLTWVPESSTLISCGWDKCVYTHNIQPLISS